MSQPDLFRARLDAMIDQRHPLAVLAQRIDWAKLEAALAPTFARTASATPAGDAVDLFGTVPAWGEVISAAGRPRLPLRLMASLAYLKHAFNLSDEALVERWSENVVWQYIVRPAKFRIDCGIPTTSAACVFRSIVTGDFGKA